MAWNFTDIRASGLPSLSSTRPLISGGPPDEGGAGAWQLATIKSARASIERRLRMFRLLEWGEGYFVTLISKIAMRQKVLWRAARRQPAGESCFTGGLTPNAREIS
jgi:hypothetical protein